MLGQAGPWDQDTLPQGLLKAHRTPGAQWGRLVILDGAVGFQFLGSGDPPLALWAGSVQPIPPGVPHCVIPSGPVRLKLEFWGRPA